MLPSGESRRSRGCTTNSRSWPPATARPAYGFPGTSEAVLLRVASCTRMVLNQQPWVFSADAGQKVDGPSPADYPRNGMDSARQWLLI